MGSFHTNRPNYDKLFSKFSERLLMEINHPEVKFGKTGVLIINLGTPDSTNWFDIRKYLKEFLSDRRVIEVNPFLWQIILNFLS